MQLQPLLVWYFIGHAARHHVSVNVALCLGMTRSAMYIERRTHHFGTMHGQTMQRLGLFLVIMMLTCITAAARAALILSADGQTVYDNSTGLTWLANFNLPASQMYGLGCNQIAGPNCVNSDGSMNYVAATGWVQQLNAHDFEGHNNWQLPTTWSGGATGCSGIGSDGNPFGFGCVNTALGVLYSHSLGLTAPNSAVPVAQNTVCVGGSTSVCFHNLQPNFYWSAGHNNSAGALNHVAFSFATGLSDGIVSENQPQMNHPGQVNVVGTFLDVLPLIPGTETGSGPPTLTDNNQAIYDPTTGTTWPVDANPAATLVATYTPAQLQTMLGMTVCNGVGTPSNAPNCINPDGSMNWSSAQQFVWALNQIKYLDLIGWTLPPFNNIGCAGQACADPTDNPLAYLYYGQNELGWTTGNPALVTPQPTAANNPFNDIQMTYYWSCAAMDDQLMAASPCDYATTTVPAPGFAWDYSLSNGYQSTDHSGLNPPGIDYVSEDFFVTAYYAVPEPPGWMVLLTGLAALATGRRWLGADRTVMVRRGRQPGPANPHCRRMFG
jgi:hypothetical protein